MDRRTLLATATSALALGLAGCSRFGGDRVPTDRTSPTATPSETQGGPSGTPPDDTPPGTDADRGVDFARTVDLVEAGADPTGNRPIDDVLAAEASDDTLIMLPPGRYRVEDEFVPEVARLGIVGPEATLVPSDGFDGVLLGLGYPSPSAELVVEGLTFDYRAPDTGGRPLLAKADDRIVARDLEIVGEADVDQDLFRFDVTHPDGEALVQGLVLPDGAPANTQVTGIEVGDDNRGNIDFVDCHVAGFPDNGLYADPPEGRVRVFGGRYENNGVAGVRVEATESVVRGVHVRCDDASGAGENMRGIRLRAGRSVLVEDCLVELLEVTGSDGAITFASELESATVRNCRLRVEADGVNAIRIKDGVGGRADRGPFVVENVDIVGNAARSAAIQAADCRGWTLKGVTIHQPGASRDGVVGSNVGVSIRDVNISVTGDPLRFVDSRVRRSGVRVRRLPLRRKVSR